MSALLPCSSSLFCLNVTTLSILPQKLSTFLPTPLASARTLSAASVSLFMSRARLPSW